MRKNIFIGAVLLFLTLALAVQAQTDRTMTVGKLFDLVEQSNRSLRTARAGVDVASYAVEEAKSQRLPDISASLSGSYSGNVLMTDRNLSNAHGLSSPHWGNSFALEAQQVVYAGGALNAGIRLAKTQKHIAETGVELTRAQQRFIVLGQYIELLETDNGIKVYESNIKLTNKLIADISEKHAQGMALKNDVTRYELQLESLRLGMRKLQDRRSVLNHQLCNALGLVKTVIWPDTSVTSTVLKDESEAAWKARAAVSSPHIRQSQLGIDAANEQLRIAKSSLLPKIAVVAADNFSGPFTYDLPPIDNNFNVWYVGVSVKYSLSSLFKSNKSVRRAKAVVNQSHDSHAAITEQVDNDIQEAYTLYRQSYADLRTRQKSVELAAQNYQVVNNRYLNQLALITDMVDASNLKLDAELQEVNARANIVYTYYKMKYITGEI